ncbi:hypothetical protein K491DRAFT_677504 [Lophiostoma macrostomum CBS 122681]|uniref:Uncharacterized protein n=1 Tax=Lophiostoma macrostomum CBS 122681 TaxID=1314788 RepID=A0A6A6TCZ4_9PLEO|nr:hypothetical protein K491DRAFT_677504 [Lophiostoma macrostomum CBS 122681]
MPRPNRYHPYNRNGTSPPMMSSRLVHPPHNTQYSASVPSSAPSLPTLTQPQQPQHLATAHVLPTISERAPIPNFKHVPTTYIRAQTSDGQDLVPRSILQGPDGTFHVQMQVVRFPSEVKTSAVQGQGQTQTQTQMQADRRGHVPSPLILDPRLSAVRASAGANAWCDGGDQGGRPPTPFIEVGMGMAMGMGMGISMNASMGMNIPVDVEMSLNVPLPRKSSGSSDSGYSDGRSERMEDECAVFSDDGEDEDEDAEGEEDDDYERDLKELVEQQRIMINVVKEAGYGMVNAGLPA